MLSTLTGLYLTPATFATKQAQRMRCMMYLPMALPKQILSAVNFPLSCRVHSEAMGKAIGKLPLIPAAVHRFSLKALHAEQDLRVLQSFHHMERH